LGDASKAREKLGWQPQIQFPDMVEEMVCHDLEEARRDALCRKEGFTTCNFHE
jgi:GDPmannose 4,6-dehydratase